MSRGVAFSAPGEPADTLALRPEELLYLSLLALTIGSAMLAAVWLMRQRARIAAENESLRAELAERSDELHLRTAMLRAEEQRFVVYAAHRAPEVVGTLPLSSGVPNAPDRFLAFDEWLTLTSASALVQAIERLIGRAEAFHLLLELPNGESLEVTGRTLGAIAFVRFAALEGIQSEFATLQNDHARVVSTLETVQSLFDAMPMPVWLRDAEHRLVWVNTAYADAVDAAGVGDATERQMEFLNQADRARIAAATAGGEVYRERLTAVVSADRRNFEVIDAAGPLGSAGIATDVSEAEAIRMELRHTIQSHSETLDHLTTAVARFDEKTQLRYYNAAFQKLFDFSSSFLDGAPDHLSLLDQLRSRGVMAEDRPLRDLKDELLRAYRATEPTDTMLHLADGRTLHVFASPQPQGGATWVYEDLTEKLQLESRLNALVRLQGETLDCLNEAVAVFGPDGRLRLSNPAFSEMWALTDEFLKAKPHIRTLPDHVGVGFKPARQDGTATGTDWLTLTRAVTAFDDGPREPLSGEADLSNGNVVSYGVVPLPNGQTMLTFIDVSDSRQAERMLRERNDALEEADRIKTDFVKHVNYELRSPLTNIIGFSALLRSVDTGPLNERQSEYLNYISTSTAALMTIVNDILDLASVDAGTMELEPSEVDIAKATETAAEAIRDRLQENDVALHVDVAAAGPRFRADEHRLTQVLFNLLSNAVNFAPGGSTVELKAWRDAEWVCFSVADKGPGISSEQLARVFDRFEADAAGGRQSGAGLGLSIVKTFVELHQGRVEIDSRPGEGTTVTCRFPSHRADYEDAAE
ncbi:ATP-binding protein [Aurantimonas sp. MSK8Z-1]|uniref:sensor histidine kinase n=1 Tax=Mangrovibrevibacter kandeliae TaxID=2968473 RepID=UPI0021180EBE|nr:PAS domain-containing sensor histidine kinase [Aurantimonas sp. MSK8Z-1]MCW4115133.1 ATP-binding protein [Aurantimonas sp. MSK8Z-1]